MNVLVSCSITNRILEVRSVLTAATAHAVASAFTPGHTRNPLTTVLRDYFGEHEFRWYCVDMSDIVYKLTFSNLERPRILQFSGEPAQILGADAEEFELYLHEAEVVKPEQPLSAAERPHSVEHLLGRQNDFGS